MQEKPAARLTGEAKSASQTPLVDLIEGWAVGMNRMEREGRKCIGWKGEEKGRAGEKKGMEGMTGPPDFKTWIHVYVNDAHKKLYTVIRKCTSRYEMLF